MSETKNYSMDFSAKENPSWCPGCGDYGILTAVKNAVADLRLPSKNVAIVSGIGCGSKLPHFVRAYGFEGLHGRTLPVASGIRLANSNLTVMAVAGDGDAYGIGLNHLMHTMRRNINLTLIVQNNTVYALTKGQTSPTSEKGFKSPSTPFGAIEEPVNPLLLGIIGGATYVARGFAFDVRHLQELIAGGIRHKGFSIIDVFQPCLIYNRVNTPEWYRERVYRLGESGHDPSDRKQALAKAEEFGDKIPIGLFYKTEKPAYEDGLPQIADVPLVEQDISNIDISPLLKRFR